MACTQRLTHALLRHGREDSDSTFERLAALASGLTYVGLCAVAVAILLGSSASGSENAHKTTGGVFGWPAAT